MSERSEPLGKNQITEAGMFALGIEPLAIDPLDAASFNVMDMYAVSSVSRDSDGRIIPRHKQRKMHKLQDGGNVKVRFDDVEENEGAHPSRVILERMSPIADDLTRQIEHYSWDTSDPESGTYKLILINARDGHKEVVEGREMELADKLNLQSTTKQMAEALAEKARLAGAEQPAKLSPVGKAARDSRVQGAARVSMLTVKGISPDAEGRVLDYISDEYGLSAEEAVAALMYARKIMKDEIDELRERNADE